MIEWLSWVQFAIAMLAGLICLAVAVAGCKPNDVTVGALAVVELALLVQLLLVLLSPLFGNHIRGDALELWMYLIAAIFLPLLAAAWAIVERVRWSNAVLAVAAFAVGVMVIRMQQIWVA